VSFPDSRWLKRWLLAGVAALVTHTASAQDLDATLREEVVMVPGTGFTESELEVTLYRPPGDGPFPVVVINHGRALGNARMQPRARYPLAAREFVSRGYLVAVPMRQGFSRSGGNEISGGCNVQSNGVQQAKSVRRTLDWLGQQAYADVSRNVVMGQSHGGLTTLAYGTDPHPGTKLLVNFAGGLRQESCTGWQSNMTRGIGSYGETTKLPSLWFYGDNDSYFAPEVWKEAHGRYQQAGGRAELVAFGNFGSDAHAMFGSRAGLPIWQPKVIAAMAQAGLPTRVVNDMKSAADITTPPASGFAKTDELDKVPVRTDAGREAYQKWLNAESPKAFVIHPVKRTWSWAVGGERPFARAMANCERLAASPCEFYAVDDAVVWKAP
jgi:dienelactone hydrolase